MPPMIPHRLTLLCPCLLALTVAGCGVETYQSRIMGNTVPFFRYHQELNSHVGPRWRKGEVSLRLPIGLKELPGPKKNDPASRDRRIPPQLGVEELTGLLGGFAGETSGVNRAGTTVKTPYYALVLSNRVLLSSRETKENPDKFDTALLSRLSEGLGGVEVRTLPRRIVGGKDFAPAVTYEVSTLEASTGDPATRYEVYVHREGRLQVAVVFAIPVETARSAPLNTRIDLSLQTLRLGGGGTADSGSQPSGSGGAPAF